MLDNNLNLLESTNEDCLKIYTLGHFEVTSGKKVISDYCKRSQQLWNLFKYILTYRDIRVIQENLFDILWTEKECDNPIKALQNLIYRLRILLDYEGINKGDQSIINYSHGCYNLNKEFNYWTDVDEFEELYKKANLAYKNDDVFDAIDLYEKALILYKGDYLSEDSSNDWISPVRNYYHGIYIDIVVKLTLLLKNHGRHQDILKLCEEALKIQTFDENLYLLYIEALIEVGNIKKAQIQYEYATSILYKDMGVKPSTALRKLYQQIKCTNDTLLLNLDSIQKMMMDKNDSDGAFYCDPDAFISFCKLDYRRSARTGQVDFMAMITIHRVKNKTQNSKILKITISSLIDMLIQDLRKGDVVSTWGESQILVLLPAITFEQANIVLARIVTKHEMTYNLKNIIIKTLLQPINCLDL